MRVVILDPFLKDLSGHSFNYTVSLKTELQRRGIPAFIWGNINADSACLEIENFCPCLTEITSKAFDTTHSAINIFYVFGQMKLLKRQLNNCVFNNTDYKLQQKDIFFIHTLYIFELLSLGFFIRQNSKVFIKKNCKIVIGFNFRYVRNSIILTFILSILYKFVCNFLIVGSGVYSVYFSDGKLLKEEYEKLLGRKLFLFSVPHPFPPDILKNCDIKEQLYQNRIMISYVGATRYNKGFDIFIKMFEHLIIDKEILEKIFFIVQLDIQKQPKSDMEIIKRSVMKLKSLSDKIQNLKIYEGLLSSDDYYKILCKSDIIILPYRDETFKTVPSNIFTETIIAGRIPVVSDGTSMAYQLNESGLKSLIFQQENHIDLVKTIKDVIGNFKEYQEKIKPLQKIWQQYYNSNTLVENLLSSSSVSELNELII